MSHRAGPLIRLLAALAGGMFGACLPAAAQFNPAATIMRSMNVAAPPRPMAEPPRASKARGTRVAEADCSAAAAEAAADTGGQVLSVTSRDEGGQTVCIVTVLVPGEGGSRPRKQTITVPQ